MALAISSREWRSLLMRVMLPTIVSWRGGQHKGFRGNFTTEAAEEAESPHSEERPFVARREIQPQDAIRRDNPDATKTWNQRTQQNQKPGAPEEAGRISGALTPKRR